jgi:hypothetical protein
VPDSLQQGHSETAVLTWEHHTTQDAACAIIQAELRRLGHDAKVKWEGYKGTSSVGWGTVFYANGEVTDTAIIIEKIGGALASTVMKECRAMLDRLFPAPHPGQVLPAQLPAPAGDVSAAPEPQSFISIEVTIVNQTGSPLVRVTQDKSWGVYTREPPLAIGSGQKATLIMESNGLATGAMGSVVTKFLVSSVFFSSSTRPRLLVETATTIVALPATGLSAKVAIAEKPRSRSRSSA